MTFSFTEVMNAAITSMEARMDQINDKYIHLFEEMQETEEIDATDLVNGIIAHMNKICDLVEETGEKLLARRNSPPSPAEEEAKE